MANSSETAAQQIAAARAAVDDVSRRLDRYAAAVESSANTVTLESMGRVSQSHTDLVASVRALNRAARGPADMMFAQIEAVGRISLQFQQRSGPARGMRPNKACLVVHRRRLSKDGNARQEWNYLADGHTRQLTRALLELC